MAAFIMVVSLQTFTSLAASGKVVAETAKIRSEASTSSSVVGSTVKGKTIDIVGAVKDSSGTVWYKVPNGNNTYGYIRSDLVETSDDIKGRGSTAASNSSCHRKAGRYRTYIYW
ncbi:MAG: SH3 domain-containing protein [Suilimivivens sp.]